MDALVDDGAGGWFVGGAFTFAGGIACPHLAHVRADLSVDTAFCVGLNAPVLALARRGTTLFVGGLFTKIGETERARLASFDARSGKLLAWDPKVGGPPLYDRSELVPQSVDALVATNSTVYVGGLFGRVGASPRHNLAAVDAMSGRVLSWSANVRDYFGTVNALALVGRRLYVGGQFTRIGHTDRRALAAVDSSTGDVETWNPQPLLGGGDEYWTSVLALAVTQSALYVGGTFTSIQGEPRRHLAAISPTTGRLLNWRADTDKPVRSLAVQGDRVYVGGEFAHIAGQPRSRAAAVGLATARIFSWNPSPLGSVEVLASARGGVLLGGDFTGMGGRRALGLTALDATGTPVVHWDVAVDGGVHALAVHGSILYVGGDFHHVAGRSREGLAALDAATGRLLDWAPRLGKRNYGVKTIAPSAGVIYVGGDFESIAGVKQRSLAALDAKTGALKDWRPSVGSSSTDDGSAQVDTILVAGETVYVGGDFDLLDGKPHAPVAAFDAAETDTLSWNPQIPKNDFSEVWALAADHGVLYVGGDFSRLDGQPRRAVAAFDVASGRLTPWNAHVGADFAMGVATIAVAGGEVYLGGSFRTVSGQPRNGLAAVDRETGAVRSWGADAPDVASIAVGSGRVYVGGSFMHVGGTPQTGVAIFQR